MPPNKQKSSIPKSNTIEKRNSEIISNEKNLDNISNFTSENKNYKVNFIFNFQKIYKENKKRNSVVEEEEQKLSSRSEIILNENNLYEVPNEVEQEVFKL